MTPSADRETLLALDAVLRDLAGFGIVSRRDPQGGGEVRRPGRPSRPGRHHRAAGHRIGITQPA